MAGFDDGVDAAHAAAAHEKSKLKERENFKLGMISDLQDELVKSSERISEMGWRITTSGETLTLTSGDHQIVVSVDAENDKFVCKDKVGSVSAPLNAVDGAKQLGVMVTEILTGTRRGLVKLWD